VLSAGVPVTSAEGFSWLDGGYFLVQTYETTFGDEPTQKGVNYWRYDTERHQFGVIFVSNNGSYTESGNRYSGEVADGKLTMEGPARFQYELDGDEKVKTNPDGTISVTWCVRDEQGDWTPWMNNRFTRVSTG
jgi:hypothetical protein